MITSASRSSEHGVSSGPFTGILTASRPVHSQVVWQIALLGPVEVRRDGQRAEVPSGKASELLVRLSLEAGELVRADRLVHDQRH
jgi:hypothetical protein